MNSSLPLTFQENNRRVIRTNSDEGTPGSTFGAELDAGLGVTFSQSVTSFSPGMLATVSLILISNEQHNDESDDRACSASN